MAWISPVFFPFIRILALFTATPVLSSRALPMRAKIGLSLLIALALQATLPETSLVGLSDARTLGVVVQQVLIGISIGFSVRVIFSAVELAGEVAGFQMGLNFASFFDPTINAQSSALARFFGQMATLLFIAMNGHILVLIAVQKSFLTFPVDANILHSLAEMKIYSLGVDLFSSALWIAMPLIGVLMFVNLALGIISRVAPQMNIFAVGFPVTLMVGLISVALMLPMLEQPFISLMERAISTFY
jgi:flagellar biosynthetic protein FliR